ncbi:MAG: hypothetical protein EA360_10915 [Balneolaceae bacterium]|nr:MAG: hypothetical protein EA360_10915 [Balneolaceae bacterium]
MYIVFQQVHSYLAWVLLIALTLIILSALSQLLRKKPFSTRFKLLALSGFILSHLQLLIGIVVYLISPFGISSFSGEMMTDSVMRLYLLEHPLTMIISIVLISLGYIKSKKPGDDVRRYKTVIIYYSAGLLFMLVRIPWDVWPF